MNENERLIAGRYRIGQLVGRGGMAEVYEGYDTRLGRTVAIKLLKSDLATDANFEAKFRQEAQASARMAHPSIVRIYDAGEEESTDANGNQVKTPFIIMELVKGRLLRDIIHEGKVDTARAVKFVAGILGALEVSHRSGVIHRDIKPANVMVGENDSVKVMDFGLPGRYQTTLQRRLPPQASLAPRSISRQSRQEAMRLMPGLTSTRPASSSTSCSRAGRHSRVRVRSRLPTST